MPDISIVVPTFRRPSLLRAAVRSCLGQIGIAPSRYEIIVVDNCPEGSALQTLASLPGETAGRLRLVHEPRPGISHARNTGIASAQGGLIAFLDDDEVASPHWLRAFLATQLHTGADAVFGPVAARLPEGAVIENPDFFLDFFSRNWDLPDGKDISSRYAFLGTNNSLFVRSRCLAGPVPFALDLGKVGGEDSLLLKQLHAHGARFAWSAAAVVDETISPERLTYDYVRRRRFRSGQIRSLVCRRTGRPHEVALWMSVGLLQALGYGAAALAFRLGDHRRAEQAAAKAAGGAGKILWGQRFLFPMYGSA